MSFEHFDDECLQYLETAKDIAKKECHQELTPQVLLHVILEDPFLGYLLKRMDTSATAIQTLLQIEIDALPRASEPSTVISASLYEAFDLARDCLRGSDSKQVTIVLLWWMVLHVARNKSTTLDKIYNSLLIDYGYSLIPLYPSLVSFLPKPTTQKDTTFASNQRTSSAGNKDSNKDNHTDDYKDYAYGKAWPEYTPTMSAHRWPLVGRKEERERLLQALLHFQHPHVLLVGDSGVGKSAMVKDLLSQLQKSSRVRTLLHWAPIYSLHMHRLVSSTHSRSDLEDHIRKQFMQVILTTRRQLFFIDDLALLIEHALSQGNLLAQLKALLDCNHVSVVATISPQAYRRSIASDPTLKKRFQVIMLEPVSQQDCLRILQKACDHYEEFHDIRYAEDALPVIVELASQYLPEVQMPGNALRLMDSIGAAVRQSKQRCSSPIVANVVRELFPLIRGQRQLVSATSSQLRNLSNSLKKLVFGQEEAVDTVVDAILMAKAGLSSPEKPLGSFLFTGPTGVGKTELAKQLAQHLGMHLIRLDMSEYKEWHTISRLLGAPPGYIGYDKGGVLAEQILQHPHSVLLLDEIEKAHPDIFNLFLQVMDYGILTDSRGQKLDFRNCVLIMTSNVGAKAVTTQAMGFFEGSPRADIMHAVQQTFTPEFRNRLDAILPFAPISKDLLDKIVEKALKSMRIDLKAKGVQLYWDAGVRNYLGQRGYDPALGARPLLRTVKDLLGKPLAQAMLFGPLAQGGKARVKLNAQQQLVWTFTPTEQKA